MRILKIFLFLQLVHLGLTVWGLSVILDRVYTTTPCSAAVEYSPAGGEVEPIQLTIKEGEF